MKRFVHFANLVIVIVSGFIRVNAYSFIRPTLEYACVVWDNNTLFLINELENVQIEAARIVTGGTRLV
jgi:hypothetical protein